jgi:hypothetical protein
MSLITRTISRSRSVIAAGARYISLTPHDMFGATTRSAALHHQLIGGIEMWSASGIATEFPDVRRASTRNQ